MKRNPIISQIPYPAKSITNYARKYYVDIHGNVYRKFIKGFRQMKPYKHNGELVLNLTDTTSKRRMHLVAHLVRDAFMPPPPEGYVTYHKNGDLSDPSLCNLDFISRAELGKMTGHKSRRKAVAKFDWRTQEVVEIYRSARQAAKANYMSYQTIMDRCNGKVKSPIAPDGYIYQWDT